jgi:hypothetical protein
MQGVTVIHSKRGGNAAASDHSEWLLTVPATPDAISFKLVPITSLLKGVTGVGFLSHAINLYLRCQYTTRNKIEYTYKTWMVWKACAHASLLFVP